MSDLSMSERQEAVTAALRKRLGADLYVVELYDERAVYTMYGEGSDAGKSFEISYTLDDAGNATLGDEPTEVKRRTTYTAVKFAEGSDSIIEGLAIPYGGSFKGKDIHGEKFTSSTDLALDWFPDEGRPALYHHGLDAAVKTALAGRQIAREERPIGQWAQVQLDKRNKYFGDIKDLVDEGALSFSSGAIPHLVQTSKSGVIERWPWVELSLTPTPAEPGLTGVYAVKAVDAIEHLTAVKAAAALVSLLNTTSDEGGSGSEPFDVHAERVASDVADFVERVKARIDLRAAKAGRELSASNRKSLEVLIERLGDVGALGRDVKEALGRTGDATKAMEELEAELLIDELRRTGIPV